MENDAHAYQKLVIYSVHWWYLQQFLRFKRQKEIFRFFKTRNCKREYLIYLMQCELYNKQYIEKAETAFNIRPNDHRKDVKDTDAILTCKYFQEPGHKFRKH